MPKRKRGCCCLSADDGDLIPGTDRHGCGQDLAGIRRERYSERVRWAGSVVRQDVSRTLPAIDALRRDRLATSGKDLGAVAGGLIVGAVQALLWFFPVQSATAMHVEATISTPDRGTESTVRLRQSRACCTRSADREIARPDRADAPACVRIIFRDVSHGENSTDLTIKEFGTRQTKTSPDRPQRLTNRASADHFRTLVTGSFSTHYLSVSTLSEDL
jgi:hypothetical protein